MYNIELAKVEDLDEFHEIIVSRCKWFEDNKINQWKINSYPKRYDITYLKNQMKENKLFIAKKDGIVVGGFLLKEKDYKYWSDCDNVEAYYIHHLAVKIGEKGLGKIMIDFAQKEARKNKKKYLRLDCVSNNKKLNNYYQKLNFENAGSIRIKNCIENLWQMKL